MATISPASRAANRPSLSSNDFTSAPVAFSLA
jgi:hypothetical protein